MKSKIALTTALILILAPGLCFAGYYNNGYAAEVIIDTVALRPLGIAAIGIGTAAVIVSLPFAVITGTTGSTARSLVKAPVEYTFSRPLGEFNNGQDYALDPPADNKEKAVAIPPKAQ